MLITALDTFDLGDAVEHEKFMKTLSESRYLRQIPNRNTSFQKNLVNTRILLHIAVSILYETDAISWYTFDAAHVMSNSCIAKKNS